ncbi:NtaA/DmoA family FMN-dependent monooxygenase [Agromyces larvae]|uniref:NtaA/DmoA family FMN-dependent monooxygenase n=1 Tax=Agromyces larvae TaxID=2929802 RepID=A0ABY4BZR4_9MICO|nr:NtaA/DmoA family FMN-dependent monooxygenase [Agromyces larvae]UOE43351.1 NtaA/DmoA family FMN-dependent monooxygenase [Agromyces larvae]
MTADRPRSMSLGMNILGLGGHAAAAHLHEVPPTATTDVDYFVNIAKISERGALDGIFLADGPAYQGGRAGGGKLDPIVLLTAVAAATERIGVIATASTSYNHPYNLARRIASLDHISRGRAGWNAVTTAGDAAARNFGQDGAAFHSDRYRRADEFIDVVTKAWGSWAPDATRLGPDGLIDRRPDAVQPIGHTGEFFSVEGAGTLPRTPQGRPVIVQAGASEGGKNLGARWADAIFTAQTTLEDGIAFARDIRARAAAFGRNPNHVRILPGLSTVIGSTEEEAQRRWDELDSHLSFEQEYAQISGRLGVDVRELDLDAPLPWEKFPKPDDSFRTSHGFLEAQLSLARRENLTPRQLVKRIRSGHRLAVGTPEQIADTLEQWFRAGAGDGFNIMPDAFPSGAEIFVDHVVPELRRRGLFRHEYEGTTLRDHLGLPHHDLIEADERERAGSRALAS